MVEADLRVLSTRTPVDRIRSMKMCDPPHCSSTCCTCKWGRAGILDETVVGSRDIAPDSLASHHVRSGRGPRQEAHRRQLPENPICIGRRNAPQPSGLRDCQGQPRHLPVLGHDASDTIIKLVRSDVRRHGALFVGMGPRGGRGAVRRWRRVSSTAPVPQSAASLRLLL